MNRTWDARSTRLTAAAHGTHPEHQTLHHPEPFNLITKPVNVSCPTPRWSAAASGQVPAP